MIEQESLADPPTAVEKREPRAPSLRQLAKLPKLDSPIDESIVQTPSSSSMA